MRRIRILWIVVLLALVACAPPSSEGGNYGRADTGITLYSGNWGVSRITQDVYLIEDFDQDVLCYVNQRGGIACFENR